ncbi:AsmA family protein [Kaarinaea lacus]
MKKSSKIILSIVIVVLIVVLVPIVLLMTVDVNQYKGVIAEAVKKQTGRDLQLQGDIQKSFFPWLGVELGAMQLSNAEGFGEAPFTSIEKAQIKIELLPLLKKQLVVDNIVLHGLRLNLARNKSGVTNWDDLIKPSAAPEEAPPGEPAEPTAPPSEEKPATVEKQLAALNIGGVDIRDAAIVWDDQMGQARYELQEFQLQTGEVVLGEPLQVSMSTRFSSAQPSLQGSLQWSGVVDAQLEQQRYALQDFKLTTDVSGEMLPMKTLSLTLAAQIAADLEQQTAKVSSLTLQSLGSTLSGQVDVMQLLQSPAINTDLQWRVSDAKALLAGIGNVVPAEALKDASLNMQAKVSLEKQTANIKPLTVKVSGMTVNVEVAAQSIIDAPKYQGRVDVQPFNPAELLAALQMELPKRADAKTLSNAQLKMSYQGSLDAVAIKPLTMKFDDTNVDGFVKVTSFANPAIAYQINVDAIDVDRYLPPTEKAAMQPKEKSKASTSKAATPAAAPEEDLPIPMEALRALNLQGDINVGKLKAMNAKLEKIKVGVNAKGGVVNVAPLQANLYQGSTTTNVMLDVRGDTPKFEIDEKLVDVNFGPLLTDLIQEDYVSGVANINAKVHTSGKRVSAMKKNLNGTANFNFDQGELKYLDVMDIILKDYSKYAKMAIPDDQPEITTVFKQLKGSATITNGKVDNPDLVLTSSRFKVNGKGNVHLVNETIDYWANTEIINPTSGMSKVGLHKLQGTPIPVHFRGTFSQPDYNVDWESVFKNKAKQELKEEEAKLKEKLKKEEDKLKEKAKKEAEEEVDKLEQKLKDKFKKLF